MKNSPGVQFHTFYATPPRTSNQTDTTPEPRRDGRDWAEPKYRLRHRLKTTKWILGYGYPDAPIENHSATPTMVFFIFGIRAYRAASKVVRMTVTSYGFQVDSSQ